MEYPEFLASISPITLSLDRSQSALDRSVYWTPSKDARRVLSSKYELSDVADDYFDIEASFSMAVQWSEDDGPVIQPLKIECMFVGHFHTSGTLDRDHAKRFAETESWLVFWPFFRQFVSDMTARMAIPPITIPLALPPGEHSYRRKAIESAAEKPHKRRMVAARKKK